MNKDKCKPIYSKQLFLNPDESPSTGSVAAFLGYFPEKDKLMTSDDLAMWLRISDCHQSISLHKCDFDYTEDFIKKMEKLKKFISDFIDALYAFKNGNL